VRLALVVALAALLAGCGADEPSTTKHSTVEVTVNGKTHTVTCPGGRGCDAPLDPVPADRACTEIFGGPATATVVKDGRTYDFNLTNGCEIARWEKASALLGEPPRRG
jgi:hypothetical protein